MFDGWCVKRYNAKEFNLLLETLRSIGGNATNAAFAQLMKTSYFEPAEFEKPVPERLITVSLNSEELFDVLEEIFKSGRIQKQKGEDWFSKRTEDFLSERNDPKWYSRYLVRPYNRQSLERLGAAAGEILLRKGNALLSIVNFEPPSSPFLVHANVLGGYFMMESKDPKSTASVFYEIRLDEQKKEWNIAECNFNARKKNGGDLVRVKEKTVNYETLEVC